VDARREAWLTAVVGAGAALALGALVASITLIYGTYQPWSVTPSDRIDGLLLGTWADGPAVGSLTLLGGILASIALLLLGLGFVAVRTFVHRREKTAGRDAWGMLLGTGTVFTLAGWISLHGAHNGRAWLHDDGDKVTGWYYAVEYSSIALLSIAVALVFGLLVFAVIYVGRDASERG